MEPRLQRLMSARRVRIWVGPRPLRPFPAPRQGPPSPCLSTGHRPPSTLSSAGSAPSTLPDGCSSARGDRQFTSTVRSKLIWTREEHPSTIMYRRIGSTPDASRLDHGEPVAWSHPALPLLVMARCAPPFSPVRSRSRHPEGRIRSGLRAATPACRISCVETAGLAPLSSGASFGTSTMSRDRNPSSTNWHCRKAAPVAYRASPRQINSCQSSPSILAAEKACW